MKRIPRNRLVRIGGGTKVYRVHIAPRVGDEGEYYLTADADHPEAAKRVPDAFRWYKRDELHPVETGI
ncbi:hypothetical protein [Mycobacteroides abscessus]|uniref:hypothetical protein n=1 Tax=Mycobacteroides abscessus TaxID=36809 RepID=UPI00078B50CD|nr:hypothetical protein [Mycobacteroides abscessus]AMU58943.1 hypothetical protein A3O03_01270 [Mycobacteroides abscessus]